MVFQRRLLKLMVLTCVALVAIWMRVVQLQAFESETWTREAQSLRQRVLGLQGPRGRILDRHGQVLARDVPIFQLTVVGAEWLRRGRIRCGACGAIRHYDSASKPRLRRCRCGAEPEVQAVMGPVDHRPLEKLLGLNPGELANRARSRIAKVDDLKASRLRRLRAHGKAEFLIYDEAEQYRRDLLHRPYVVVARLEPEAVRLVELDEVGNYRGFRVRPDLRREYAPDGPAAQFLGYVRKVRDESELERLRVLFGSDVSFDTRIGCEGVEKGRDPALLGRSGSVRQARDADGDFTIVVREQLPARGEDVRLALTSEACLRSERALSDWGGREGYFPQAQPSGGFVAVYADTGEIVAWGEMPRMDVAKHLKHAFDSTDATAIYDPDIGHWVPKPNATLRTGLTLDEWLHLLSKPAPLHLSRVSEIPVEPGSTFKLFVGLGLLEGVRHMRPGATLPFETPFMCGGRRMQPKCHAHRHVLFEGAIEVSCNRYFALSLRDSPSHWAVYRHSVPALLQRLGFGRRTGADVWREHAGTFLRNYVDLDPREVTRAAIEKLKRERGLSPDLIRMRVERGLPARVAGRDPQRLHRLLDRVLGAALDVAQGEPVVVTLAGSPGEFREQHVSFRIVIRPRPGHTQPKPIDRKGLSDAVTELGGHLQAEILPGGIVTMGFTLRYHEAIGRKPGEPIVILPDDGRNLAIGQGPITVTPLQMVRAVAAIANGGRLVTPHAAVRVGELRLDAPAPDLGLDPGDLRRLRAGMRAVVEGSQGTARGDYWHKVPATVYGKTGTAQVGGGWKPEGITGDGPWHHWFVGFAEAPDARPLAFACVLHSRTEGSAAKTAAHAVCDMLAWWYREGPDAR